MTTGTWSESSAARRVRVYIGENDKVAGAPAQHAILSFLRSNDAAGATTYRGMEGFGASGRVHSSRLAEVPWDLPVIIEWIDTPERVQELLPRLQALVPAGIITVEPTEVALFAPRKVRPMSEWVPVEAVMTRAPATVKPEATVRDIVELLRARSLRAVPVVDQGNVVGMVTHSDLIKRGGLGVRLTLLPGLSAEDQARYLDELPPALARDIMSAPAVVVDAKATLSTAAEIMVRRKLKRLPVVDERGALAGMISRLDLLRSVADFGERQRDDATDNGLRADGMIASVMREDVPTVYPDSPLHDVVQAVVSTRLDRALVVDADRHVLGMVTSRAVLERLTPALHTGVLKSLMHRIPLLRPAPDAQEWERHARARTARELMIDVPVVHSGDALREVSSSMVDGAHKLVAVVDDGDRLVGVVDRADVLRGIVFGG